MDDPKKSLPLTLEKTGEPLTGPPPIGAVLSFDPVPPEESIILLDPPSNNEMWEEEIDPHKNELLPPDKPSDRVELPPISENDYTLAFELIPAAESIVDKVKRDEAVRKFTDLVKDGVEPRIAAARIQRNLPQQPWIKKTFRSLLENYHWNADVDREIVRSGRRKVLLDALEDGDRKAAAAMMKQIAEDPLVGLAAPPVTINTIEIGELAGLLGAVDKTQVIDIPKELADS